MSGAARPQNASSRDLALSAIKEAHGLLGQADQERGPVAEPVKAGGATYDLSDARAPQQLKKLSATMFMPRRLAGVLPLACIGVAVLAWQSNHGQVASEPLSTSSISIKKQEEQATRPASHNSDVPPASQVQAAPQSAPIAPLVASMAPEQAHRMEEMARELANVEQGIDQLKTERSQMAGVNAEVVEQLKAMRELARHNAELIEDLKTMQTQTAHEISNLAEQLKENQVLLATTAKQLKESEEQVGRLLASEPRQRQRAASSLPPTPVTLARKPAPKPPAATIGVQTQNSNRLHPKQD